MPIRSALLLIALCLTGLRTPDAQAQEILNTLWPRAIAQAGDEQTAIPDTTTPWRYFPLAAGNVWEYQDADGLVLRMVIVRDSTFDGHHYFQLDYRGYGRGPAYAQFSHYDLYLRYDTTEQRAYENHPNVEDESIYPYTPCALNAPFDEIADCGFAGSWYVGGRYDGVLVFGGERPGEGSDTLRTPVKSFIQLGVGLERRLAAGIGLIYHSVEGYGWGLVYARVGGVEYGERRIIVGNEPEEQPSLSVSPDTLRYPSVREVLIENTGPEPLRIDSLGISKVQAHAWHLDVTAPDSAFRVRLNSFEHPTQSVGLFLAPGDSAALFFVAYDPCIVCKGGIFADDLKIVDTLFVFTSDPTGVAAPGLHKVYLDISTLVSNEGPPVLPDQIAVDVYPNPARDRLSLVLNTTSVARVETYDLLGRLMRQQDVPDGVGVQAVTLDVSALPAGFYLVRLVTADGVSSTHPFVVQR